MLGGKNKWDPGIWGVGEGRDFNLGPKDCFSERELVVMSPDD